MMDLPFDPRHAQEWFAAQTAPQCVQGPQNPRVMARIQDMRLQPPQNPLDTLTEELGIVVDEARELEVELGLRPYRVFTVVVEWDGGEVGRGVQRVVSEREFLPTPKVSFGGLSSKITEGGRQEGGTAQLSRISPRMTETEIRRSFPSDLGPTQQYFIEIQMDRRDGIAPRRRFVVTGVPFRDAEKFEWRATLFLQNGERKPAGQLPELTVYPPRFRGD
jgi:hypothetical protein